MKPSSISSSKHMMQKQRPAKLDRAVSEPPEKLNGLVVNGMEVRRLAVPESFKLCTLADFSTLPAGPFLHHNALAKVYVSRTLKHQYVVKQIVKRNSESVESLLHEAAVLTYLSTKLKHQNFVVDFYGIDMGVTRNVLPALVFEKMECSFQDWLKRSLSSNLEKRRNQLLPVLGSFTIQLTSALRWLHDEAAVVHGDIKPSNILIRSRLHVSEVGTSTTLALCFADFASACIIDQPKPAHTGLTYAYMAPEKLRKPQDTPTLAGDVWALGITMLEMVVGRDPYRDINPRMRKLAAIGHGEPIAYVRDEIEEVGGLKYAKDVLGPALEKDPMKRVTAREWPAIAYHHFLPSQD
jgi:serine/threonine protein kinase